MQRLEQYMAPFLVTSGKYARTFYQRDFSAELSSDMLENASLCNKWLAGKLRSHGVDAPTLYRELDKLSKNHVDTGDSSGGGGGGGGGAPGHLPNAVRATIGVGATSKDVDSQLVQIRWERGRLMLSRRMVLGMNDDVLTDVLASSVATAKTEPVLFFTGRVNGRGEFDMGMVLPYAEVLGIEHVTLPSLSDTDREVIWNMGGRAAAKPVVIRRSRPPRTGTGPEPEPSPEPSPEPRPGLAPEPGPEPGPRPGPEFASSARLGATVGFDGPDKPDKPNELTNTVDLDRAASSTSSTSSTGMAGPEGASTAECASARSPRQHRDTGGPSSGSSSGPDPTSRAPDVTAPPQGHVTSTTTHEVRTSAGQTASSGLFTEQAGGGGDEGCVDLADLASCEAAETQRAKTKRKQTRVLGRTVVICKDVAAYAHEQFLHTNRINPDDARNKHWLPEPAFSRTETALDARIAAKYAPRGRHGRLHM
jgi:hypothetical protein